MIGNLLFWLLEVRHRWRFALLRRLNAVHKPYYDCVMDAYIEQGGVEGKEK